MICLEGLYVNTFSGNPQPTPNYEYNQIMYRLNLADPRLKLPRSVGSQGSAARQPAAPPRKASLLALRAAYPVF